jgi:O-antigen ligase
MTMPSARAQGRERLTFGGGTVPRAATIRAAGVSDAYPPSTPLGDARSRDWGYFGLLAFTAMLVLRPQDQIPGVASLHLAEICALLGVAPMVMYRLSRGLPILRLTKETVGVLGFGLVLVGTAPFSIWPGGALQEIFDTYLKVLIVFVLMMNTLTTQKWVEQLMRVFLMCCGYIALLALSKYARGLNVVEGERLDGPVRGLMGNPNDLAMNLVTFLPLAVTLALTESSTVRRLAAVGIAIAMFATIVLTKSRSGALGLVVMLAVLIVLGRKIRPGFAVLALAAVLASVPVMPSSFWMRMSSIFNAKEDRELYTGSRETRSNVMKEGIATFLEYPLTGVGAGQFKNYNPPGRKERWTETHNSLIQVAAETGVAGLVAFVFLVWRAGVLCFSNLRLLRRPRRGERDALSEVMTLRDRQALYAHSVALTAGLSGWCVCALFANIAYGWTFYYTLALIVATHELMRGRLEASRASEQKMARPSLNSPRLTRSLAGGGI